MLNARVQAAAEGLPEINRRRALAAGLVVLATATAMTVEPAPAASPIEALFAEWKAMNEATWDENDKAADAHFTGGYRAARDALLASKPTTARDLAMIFIADTGDFTADNSQAFDDLVRNLVEGGAA